MISAMIWKSFEILSLMRKSRLEAIEKYGRWSGKRNCNLLSEKSGVLRALLT